MSDARQRRADTREQADQASRRREDEKKPEGWVQAEREALERELPRLGVSPVGVARWLKRYDENPGKTKADLQVAMECIVNCCV